MISYPEKSQENKEHKRKEFSNVSFSGCFFMRCIFISCRFSRCNFRNAYFSECSFKNCSMDSSNIEGCRFQDVLFEESKIVGAEFHKCDRAFFSIRFETSVIMACNFSELKMRKTRFCGSRLRSVISTTRSCRNLILRKLT